MTTRHDNIMGCIIGGAIGDYLGSPFEGRSTPFSPSIPEYSEITDDTQLTLATCEAIIHAGKPDPNTIAKTFSMWHSAKRIRGVGSSTLKALRDLSLGAHWAIAGAKGEMSAGNGAAMRIAPLSFCVDPFSQEGRFLIKDVASITHRNDEAFAGALAVVISIASPSFNFIPAVINALPDSNTRDRLIELSGQGDKTLFDLATEFGASGYAADSVPLALIAASRYDGKFLDALLEVISCGGDCDTIGSIMGQIIGSKVGASNIPENLRALPFGQEDVILRARQFAAALCSEGKMEQAPSSGQENRIQTFLNQVKRFLKIA